MTAVRQNDVSGIVDGPVINVLFHGVGTPRRALDPGEERYWVALDRFDQLLDEVMTWPNARISFDDGNISDVEHALAALQRRGLRATFFVIVGRLGQLGSLGTADVRALRDSGMAIGSHGLRHLSWRGLRAADSEEELVTARSRLAEVLGSAVDEAACPLGQYDRGLLRRLRTLGYRRVFTSDRRPVSASSWLQARYSVYADDTVQTLRAAVFQRSVRVRARAQLAGVVKRWR